MTNTQSIELVKIAKQKGYSLALNEGLVQFQVVDAVGCVEKEITGWIGYDEAIEIMGMDDE